MKRSHIFLSCVVVALVARASVGESDQAASVAVVEKIIHAEAQAWQYAGVDLRRGQVAVITVSGEWETNPDWHHKVGAGGNGHTKAAGTYVCPGAHEGCMLVRTGDKVLSFSTDAEAVTVNTAGKIYFCANDEPTERGAARFKEEERERGEQDYVGAVAIPASKRRTLGNGFVDNSGGIWVRVAVRAGK